MSKIKYIVITFLIVFLNISARSETIEKASAFQGRHFAVSFMQNEIERDALTMTASLNIFISSTGNDTITVSIPLKPVETYIISSVQILEISIPTYCEIKEAGLFGNKTIDIRSKNPITCWVYSSKNQSSDSYIAIPVNRWGKEYRIISMPNDMYNGQKRLEVDGTSPVAIQECLTSRSGEFLIIANFDNTTVTYTPTANTRNGIKKGETALVEMKAGEVLLVQAHEGAVGTEDLTGTLVRSNNPIGVLSGHMRTAVEQGLDLPYDTKDHLVEMLPPINNWGYNFFSIPFIDGQFSPNTLCFAGDLIRVIARDDDTKINYFINNTDGEFTNHSHTIKNAGDFFQIESNMPIYWQSDKPIMISQMMMHKGIQGESQGYDPALVVLSPIEQFIENVTFSTARNPNIFPQFKQYLAHCVIVVADVAAINNLFLDNAALNERNTAVWKKRIGDSEYYWAMIDVKNGNHNLWAAAGSFSGIIYGHGERDSYAMTLGSLMNDPDKPDTIAPVITVSETCGNVHFRISDIKENDNNATGIEWGFITKNLKNYAIQPFQITDTSTVVDIYASPINKTLDGVIEIEFYDKGYNKSLKKNNYHGMKINCPSEHNFYKVNWVTSTQANITIKNNGTSSQKLLSIIQPDDERLQAKTDKILPYSIASGQEITITLTFNPDGTTSSFDTKVSFNFECDWILDTRIIGEIAAPGLVAQNLDFGKLRIGDSKSLTGKMVNAGNININVTSIEYSQTEPCFEKQYTVAFPCDLKINDSVLYTVQFNPSENKIYDITANIINDLQLNSAFNILGIGASPNIENLTVDFGKQRIGTSLDTVAYITNSGNYNDTINFKQVIVATDNYEDMLINIKNIKNIFINENDSVPVSVLYNPVDTIALYNQAELTSQWSGHQPILITIQGQGTIPVIQTKDYDFGVVPIYTTKRAEAEIVFSKGNEALTIDSILPLSGDIDAFYIDYSKVESIIINKNSFISLPITFNPKHSGAHRLVLAVTHDANPAYMRSVDTVVITGYGSSDNEDYLIKLNISQIDACNTSRGELVISNNSEAKMVIDSIHMYNEPNVFSAAFIDDVKLLLPLELEAGNAISFPINIYAERNCNGKLHVNIYYNDEVVRHLEDNINPIASTINASIELLSDGVLSEKNIAPGDSISLIFNGIVEKKSEGFFSFSINIAVDKQLFYLLEKISYIECVTGSDTVTLQVNLKQYDKYIEVIATDSNIQINDNATIKFQIKLLSLLSLNTKANIGYEITSNRCYAPGITDLNITISPICEQDLRQITLDGFSYVSINPNPVINHIDFTINLLEEDIVDITIFDIQGKIIFEKTQICLENGKHNFIFDVSEFINSEYFITTKSRQLNSTQKLMIVK